MSFQAKVWLAAAIDGKGLTQGALAGIAANPVTGQGVSVFVSPSLGAGLVVYGQGAFHERQRCLSYLGLGDHRSEILAQAIDVKARR